MVRSRTSLVKPLSPSTRDWNARTAESTKRKNKPQQVHPEPNKRATDKYLEMMFGGWR